MDITVNLNANIANLTNIKVGTNAQEKGNDKFDSIFEIGKNLSDNSIADNKNVKIKENVDSIESTREIKNEKIDKTSDKEDITSPKEVKEDDEDVKGKKKKQECAASELLNMIMNTLTNEDVKIEDFVTVNEDMTISFNDEKLGEFISEMQTVYEGEAGLNFNEVLENVTNILMNDNQEENVLATDKDEKLIGMAIDFIETKINELLPEELNVQDIEIDSEDFLKSTLSNQSEVNVAKVEIEDVTKVTDDEVLNGVKDIINELLGNVTKEGKDKKTSLDKEIVNLENTQIDSEESVEDVQVVKDVDTELNKASEENEDKSDIKDGKRENKDVKRVNINNDVDYTLGNKNTEVRETYEKVSIANVRETFLSDFTECLNVVKQTVSGISLSMSDSSAEMEMKLNPENLGKINLKVATENGIVMAKFEAESQKVKEILEANLSLLKESLSEKGISVQSLEVSVNTNASQDSTNYNYEKNANKSNNPHKIPRNSINKIFSAVDNTSRNKLRRTSYLIGNNVNYIA